MLGAAPLGGGFASRAVSYAAGSQVRDSARQHLPSWAGGQSAQTPQGEGGAGRRLRNAATLAGAAATGGTRAAAAMAGAGPSTAVAGAGGATAPTGAGAAAAGTGGRTRRRRPRSPAPLDRDSRTVCRPRASPAASRTSPTRSSKRSSASARIPCRPSRPRPRSRACPRTPSVGSDSSWQTTAPARASISPTRRWANGPRRSAKRCVRSPPPAPTCAPGRRCGARPHQPRVRRSER